jgi:hypothetical protein
VIRIQTGNFSARVQSRECKRNRNREIVKAQRAYPTISLYLGLPTSVFGFEVNLTQRT